MTLAQETTTALAGTFGAGEWSLLDPWFLGVVPVVWLGLLWRVRRQRAALPAASTALFDGLPRSLRARLVQLPTLLKALAITALALALARPVTREVVPTETLGVDILLLLDISSSMGAPDMADDRELTRIEAARDEALAFASGRKQDRLGLMTYAYYPELRCPLTLDNTALSAFLRGTETVQPNGPEDATAIGRALASAVSFLEGSVAESRVVVLLTDGQNNVQDVLPADAAKLAVDAGVRVHTIGLGRGRQMPGLFGLGGQTIEADFSEIEDIAKVTGGRFFKAGDADALGDVYAAIDAMEKIELEDPRYRTSDGFAWPLVVGVSLLALGLLLELFWIRGGP